jgi:hypothetical protein
MGFKKQSPEDSVFTEEAPEPTHGPHIAISSPSLVGAKGGQSRFIGVSVVYSLPIKKLIVPAGRQNLKQKLSPAAIIRLRLGQRPKVVQTP